MIGKPPTASEAIATLVIASLDRSEEEILSLPRIIASIGRNIGQVYQNSDHGILEDVQLLQDITLPRGQRLPPLSKPKQMLMVVSPKSPSSTFQHGQKEPWIEALHGAGYPKVDPKRLSPCLSIWNFASSKSLLTTNWEPLRRWKVSTSFLVLATYS